MQCSGNIYVILFVIAGKVVGSIPHSTYVLCLSVAYASPFKKGRRHRLSCPALHSPSSLLEFRGVSVVDIRKWCPAQPKVKNISSLYILTELVFDTVRGS